MNIGITGSEDYEGILGVLWTCDCPEELRMSDNEKGTSKVVKVLAAKSCRQTMWRDSMVERSGIDQRH